MGRPLAERLGYLPTDLDRIPTEAIDSFAGVGYYFHLADLKDGETVVDLGSGSGMDSFIATACGIFWVARLAHHLLSWSRATSSATGSGTGPADSSSGSLTASMRRAGVSLPSCGWYRYFPSIFQTMCWGSRVSRSTIT